MPRAPEISTSKFQGCWTQWQRYESSSIHHFWDTCLHFLKTHFCLESVFLLSLVAPEISIRWVASQVLNTTWQRFESSSIHCFWDTPQHFLKTHFCFESSSFRSFLRYQNRDDLHTTAQTHFCLDEWLPLADGPPCYQSRDALHTTTQIWQMNLLWLNTMAKVWKL